MLCLGGIRYILKWQGKLTAVFLLLIATDKEDKVAGYTREEQTLGMPTMHSEKKEVAAKMHCLKMLP